MGAVPDLEGVREGGREAGRQRGREGEIEFQLV